MYLPPNPDIFAIQFGGIIENISIELDMASRTKIMNLIDEARKAGKLTRDRRYNRNSFFKFDVNSFKIVTDDNKQDVLVRMPIHQVACFSYVYEDDQHIIAIKYAISRTAVQLCRTLLLRALQLGGHSDDDIIISSWPQPHENFSNSCLDVRDPLDANGGQQLSSIFNNSSNNNNKSDVTNDVINQGYVSESDSSQLSMKEQELIRDYMRKLYNVLTNFELESFAQLVKSWQRDIPFHDFMNQLLQLYGEKRKYLLKEMRPFIPTKDISYYESFLAQHQLTDDKK
ncbi:hypothetical protein HELRODRAFT_184311 [Helobdella robusta]|uniref:Cerebral cavernous malformations 2 harmonin-homology domain-containing protein n=1 Tax=Helobdella robusta TaxID=6412 RepID=T1FKY8_HELRO|nr:hypothetical protein HELRODRAFT_184311 [Helobdella robusta]ESO02730.1 hypothetical protein HELRODRAFT_184311 [Helobdella robusta]